MELAPDTLLFWLKKLTAVINSIGASAAYGIATAADEIVVTESGVAGSIGVVMVP